MLITSNYHSTISFILSGYNVFNASLHQLIRLYFAVAIPTRKENSLVPIFATISCSDLRSQHIIYFWQIWQT